MLPYLQTFRKTSGNIPAAECFYAAGLSILMACTWGCTEVLPWCPGITGDCGTVSTQPPGSGHVVCPPKLSLAWFGCRHISVARNAREEADAVGQKNIDRVIQAH